jgi:Ca2+-binding RTX toxin-like protein
MKIHGSFSGQRARTLARTALAVGCVLGVLVPFAPSASAERSATGPSKFKTLEEAVAAGQLDAAVLRELREEGRASALVTFEHKAILANAEQSASNGEQRATEILDSIRPALGQEKARAFAQLHGGVGRVVREYEFLPASFVEFESAEALLTVLNSPGVAGVGVDRESRAGLAESLPLIGQPLAAASGYTGAGTEIAVLDTGILLANFGCTAAGAGCVIAEDLDYGANDNEDMRHGTNVAGIASGVAPGARIVAMDVFRQNAQGQDRANDADIIAALNDVVVRRRQGRNIRAVNMSIFTAGTYFTSACSTTPGTQTNNPYTGVFDTLRRAGILPVVIAGNSAMTTNASGQATFRIGLAYPGCTAGALSVGAVYDADRGQRGCDPTTAPDQIACYSQTGANLTMLAPGALITAAGVPDYSGTSMAAPHVAGAVAVLAAAKPDAPASAIEQALAGNGPMITDTRFQPGITKRRLDLCGALHGLLGSATARVTAPALRYTAGACEANRVTVSLASGVYTITDPGAGATITAGPGCSPVAGNPHQVTCPASGISELSISTGDRDDTVSVAAATRASISGGTGNDTLGGGPAQDTLAGDDGGDRLDGADGSDVLRGGYGADVLRGGLGTDRADYQADVPGGREMGVTITVDGASGDGWQRGSFDEGDNVLTDVEWLVGTLHDDTLTGSSVGNVIWGIAGADTMSGAGGGDTLLGEAGPDTIRGDDGADVLDGGNDDDVLSGGFDRDDLRGGYGRDTLTGEDGDDVLDGGPGGESADGLADAGDTLSGAAGVDRASYLSHFAAVNVTLDGTANDGTVGEADNVMLDVEHLTGSRFGDSLTGSKAANTISGSDGNDVLRGGVGADSLFGDGGNDTLAARAGTAFLLDPDSRVDCGAGTLDSAQIDRADPVVSCEFVS